MKHVPRCIIRLHTSEANSRYAVASLYTSVWCWLTSGSLQLFMQCTCTHSTHVLLSPVHLLCHIMTCLGKSSVMPLAHMTKEQLNAGCLREAYAARARAILLPPSLYRPNNLRSIVIIHQPFAVATTIKQPASPTHQPCPPHQRPVCSAKQLALRRAPSYAHARPMLSTSSHAASYPPSEP